MKIAARYWLRFFTLASLGLMLNILIGSSFAALSAPELAACAALVQNNAHELFSEFQIPPAAARAFRDAAPFSKLLNVMSINPM
jgi:hypothetical protein